MRDEPHDRYRTDSNGNTNVPGRDAKHMEEMELILFKSFIVF